ncbi:MULTISPECIES: hypothetical protein [unclassified Ruegeria]|uniref:hypothetical protein n=1 Tax=unclassified Ruegeria TaxID=2625375 RepID=UPI0014880564|nr:MULTISPECIES: hypothetical protein [unclassified Ruegeria]
MKTVTSIKTVALISGIFAALPHVASADSGVATVTNTNPTSLKVLSNGQNYTKLDLNGKFVVGANLKYDTGTAGRIKKWTMEPEITHGFGIAAKVQGTSFYKKTVSYSVGNRPKSIDYNWPFALSVGTIESAAVSMCEMKATVLRNQGKSDKQIFGSNHEVSFKVSLKTTVEASGAGSNNQIWEYSAPKTVKIVCSKFSGPRVPLAGGGVKGYTQPVSVKKATMKLTEIAPPNGACKIKTTTAISTNTANAQIKYRFVHNTGKKSNVFTAKTAANKIAVVQHTWDIPNGNGPENGWVKIEGVSPKFQSNGAKYSMNCKSPGIGGFKVQSGGSKPKTLRLN